jgi:hypothetical protein
LRIGPADPRALGVKRFMVGAVSATASLTRSFAGFKLLLFSALAIADFKVFDTHDRANFASINFSLGFFLAQPFKKVYFLDLGFVDRSVSFHQ